MTRQGLETELFIVSNLKLNTHKTGEGEEHNIPLRIK